MSWKTVIIKNSEYLFLKNGLLTIKNNNELTKVENISALDMIIIENRNTVLSVPLINELSNNNVSIVTCDTKGDPSALIMPFFSHHKPSEKLHLQFNFSKKNYSLIWKLIIQRKIENQQQLLEKLNCDQKAIDILYRYSKSVIINDSNNREGLAARVFFRELYGSNFIRFSDNNINSALNYGYKILASYISRTIIKNGLNPSIGIWHKTASNYFNLTYDLIEPFRPLIDEIVSRMFLEEDVFTYSKRIKLINVLYTQVKINGRVTTMTNAIEEMVMSFSRCLINQSTDIILPHLSFDE